MHCLISVCSLSPLTVEETQLAKVVWDQELERRTGTF